ncbi:MAG: hypothetical protein ACMXYA_01525 [Candidatus Woesearchaeota archaeon]
MNIQIASSKFQKRVYELLEHQYGFTKNLESHIYINEKEKKIFLLHDNSLDLEEIRVNSLGLYFGEYNDAQTEIRLSIDGSQIVGKHATKNVVTLTDEEFAQWVRGIQVDITESLSKRLEHTFGYIIFQNTLNDCFGVGRVKNGSILTFVTKARWVKGSITQAHELPNGSPK